MPEFSSDVCVRVCVCGGGSFVIVLFSNRSTVLMSWLEAGVWRGREGGEGCFRVLHAVTTGPLAPRDVQQAVILLLVMNY